MRAAEVGIVLWKKLRSSTFMARLMGGANMSGEASDEAIGGCSTGREGYLIVEDMCSTSVRNFLV